MAKRNMIKCIDPKTGRTFELTEKTVNDGRFMAKYGFKVVKNKDIKPNQSPVTEPEDEDEEGVDMFAEEEAPEPKRGRPSKNK